MSSHTLEGRGYNALACGPDIHIPARTNKNLLTLNFGFICKSLIAM